MSRANEFARRATLTAAIIFSLIGVALSIAAILTPSWQVVNLREYNSIHEHGLWLDCTRHSRDGGSVLMQRYATISEPLHCVYKFDYDKYSGTFDLEDDNSPVGEVNRHKFYGWHTATLILLGLAILTTGLSTVLGMCSCCWGSVSLVFTAITLLTTFLSSVAEGIFFFYSHRADNRFIKGIVGTYEQRVGLAFFLQLAACFAHSISFVLAMLFTYFAFAGKSKGASLDRYSLNRSSRTNVTNIGRSMEFDAPLMFPGTQQQQPQQTPMTQLGFTTPHTRPYYTKHHETMDDRMVAESMPELGAAMAAGRAYPGSGAASVTAPVFEHATLGRIRRKSETCV